MKIGLDLDDVIADCLEAFLRWYNHKTGKNFLREQFKENDWWLVFGITGDELIKSMNNEFHEKIKIEDLKPIQGALESINYLLEKGDELFIITARPEKFKKKVEAWIKYHLKTDKIKVVHSGMYNHADSKADVCKKLKIDVFVEDFVDTALACAEKGIKVLLFNQNWNQNLKHENIVRVRGWKELIQEVDKLRKE